MVMSNLELDEQNAPSPCSNCSKKTISPLSGFCADNNGPLAVPTTSVLKVHSSPKQETSNITSKVTLAVSCLSFKNLYTAVVPASSSTVQPQFAGVKWPLMTCGLANAPTEVLENKTLHSIL